MIRHLMLRMAIFSLVLGAAGNVLAQTAAQSRVSVTVKGGVSSESAEDGLNGTAPAGGVAVSFPFNPRWAGELEVWVPGYLRDDNGEPFHRDVLFGFNAVRRFRTAGTRPFVLVGYNVARIEDRFTFCFANRSASPGEPLERALVSCDEPDIIDTAHEQHTSWSGYLTFGGGVEIPVAPRVRLVLDLRANVAPTAAILRPAAGVTFAF